MKNAFNQEIPPVNQLLADKKINQFVGKTLVNVLNFLEIRDAQKLVETTLDKAARYKSLSAYEREVHLIFDEKRITQRIPAKLSDRAEIIFEQIKDFLQGHDVLDLGCGDGKVGEMIAKEQSRQVVLADIYEHGHISTTDLPFSLIKKNKQLPFRADSFDTTLLLTVLHHSDDPLAVLKEAKRVTRTNGRIIVIESVYGIKAYGKLSREQQRLANIFFDHFYNRIIHYSEFKKNKVNVPYNFRTPQDWNKLFSKLDLAVEATIDLGFDQPTVPEYHTLHVVKVK
jgi:SAM-dependent methyltransferase